MRWPWQKKPTYTLTASVLDGLAARWTDQGLKAERDGVKLIATDKSGSQVEVTPFG
jgi:hypothetical protein